MTPAFTLRAATPRDAPAVRACVQAAYGHYVKNLGQTPGPLLDDYDTLLKEHHAWVMEDAGQVVALLILIEKENHILLDNVAVHPNYQGKGLGKKFMALAEDEARKLEYQEIQLYTHEKMLENQALYKKLGYEEFDRRSERGINRVYMKKRLT